MARTLTLVIAVVVLTLAGVVAQTLPQGVQQVASMGGITEYDFPNGLRVLLYPDSAQPKITVNVTYLVGSRHEGYGETGMAHLLEHMNFIETTSGRKIKDELVARGASWNGTTSDDRTNYFETFTATDDNLRWALGLETDRMVNVKFTKPILDTEMTVVRNEFERGENSPASVLSERVAATAYLWHNYGKSTIGSKEDIEKVPVDRLAAFYAKFYQPDDAVLVVTGRIDEAKTLQMIAESMGKLPRPTRVLDRDLHRGARAGRRAVRDAATGRAGAEPDRGVPRRGGRPSGRGGASGLVGCDERHRSAEAAAAAAARPDGRLAKALVDTKLAQSANMGFRPLHDPGLVEVSATLTKDQSLDAARDAIYRALDDIVKYPLMSDEVERAKSQLLRGLENSLSNSQSIATGALNNAIAQGDWRLMFLQHDLLKDVQPADLVRVAKAYFKPSNRTVGYYIPDMNPDRTVVPPRPDLASTLRDYKSAVTVVRGETFDPTIANIESRVVRARLANGMRVAVLPKKTANNIVTGVIELRFGDQTTPREPERSGVICRKPVDGGHEEPHPPAAPGGAAEAERAGQCRRRARRRRRDVERHGQHHRAGGEFPGGGAPRGRDPEGAGLPAGRIRSDQDAAHESAGGGANRADPAGDGAADPAPESVREARRAVRADPGRAVAGGQEREAGGRQEVPRPVLRCELRRARRGRAGGAGRRAAGGDGAAWARGIRPRPTSRSSRRSRGSRRSTRRSRRRTKPTRNSWRASGSRCRRTIPTIRPSSWPAIMFGEPITSRISNRIRNREGLSYGANARITVPAEGDSATLAGTVSLNPAVGPKSRGELRR